jgi:hypothetical protein
MSCVVRATICGTWVSWVAGLDLAPLVCDVVSSVLTQLVVKGAYTVEHVYIINAVGH